jgi:hypothetical protein
MEKLTIQIVEKSKMTAIECVQYYCPEVSKEKADYIVWNETCFPFSLESFLEQLYHMFNKNKQTVYDR